MPSKYDPLRRYLMNVSGDRVRLSFEGIERILQSSLPDSARRYAPWWANTGGSHIQADAWMNAGWRTAQVDVGGGKVTFERQDRRWSPTVAPPHASTGMEDGGTPFASDDVITVQRTSLRGGALRLLEDYCEENGGTLADAVAGILNEMALERRRQLLDWIRANAPRVPGDSTDLIREERDAR